MSAVRQLSVFIANEAGRVTEVTRILGDAGINIRRFVVSDTADFGILRLVVVDDADRGFPLPHGAPVAARRTAAAEAR